MPIIDVSQKSYRSLVRAAHKRGMSIDRYIQRVMNEDSGADDAKEAPETVPTPEPSLSEVLRPVAPVELGDY